jgi:predicted nucleic acid-binding protein
VILLDTTVLVYAVGSEHPLRAPSRAIVEHVVAGTVRATTTIEVIQEFAHVRGRRRGREDAASVARAFAGLLGPLATVGPEDLDVGLHLYAGADRLGSFDAVLAAVALDRAATLVSADAAFSEVDDLRRLELGQPDLLERLDDA